MNRTSAATGVVNAVFSVLCQRWRWALTMKSGGRCLVLRLGNVNKGVNTEDSLFRPCHCFRPYYCRRINEHQQAHRQMGKRTDWGWFTMKKTWYSVLTAAVVAAACATTGTTTRVTSGSDQSIAEAQAVPYDGPQARIAVARFTNKSADSRNWYNPQIGDGMADMLTTALVNTGRFIVLERESLDDVLYEQDLGASGRVRADTAAAIGEIEGAEILVVAAVTEFDDNAGGTRGGVGGFGGGILGAIAGGSRSAHMAIDLRLVDARTSRVLAATSVEGEAKDFNLGGALAGYTGTVGLGGALQSWENTPREKALRQVIGAAVDYVISKTPQQYYRHGTRHSAPAAATGEQVVITATSLNVRSGPGTTNPVQFALTSGAIVEVLGRASGWVQIQDSQGRSGWVAEQFTTVVQ